MINYILADYYEERGFAAKSRRLRKRNSLVSYGWYSQYTFDLGLESNYGYDLGGDAWWFLYGGCHNYIHGNGHWYEYQR